MMELKELIDRAIIKEESPLYRAEYIATLAHEGQTRKNGDPYITHPKAVVDILKNEAGIEDENVLVVAWLHDVVEDTEITCDDIEKWFDVNIARWVEQLTTILPYNCKPLKRHDVKRAMLLSKASQMEETPIYVKLADRIHNMRSLEESGWTDKIKKGYAKDGVILAETLLDRYRILLNDTSVDMFLLELIWDEADSYTKDDK